jgi:tryptophanase
MYANATATAFPSVYLSITSNTNCGEAVLMKSPLTPGHIAFAQCGPASNINYTPITNR